MVGNYKRKSDRQKWSEAAIKRAIEMVSNKVMEYKKARVKKYKATEDINNMNGHIARAPELMIMTMRQFVHVNCALNKNIPLRSVLPSRWYHFTCSWGQNGPKTVIFLKLFFSYQLMFKFEQRRFYERNYVLLL